MVPDPTNYDNAYWEINYLQVFTKYVLNLPLTTILSC